jgi:hypothetical protein
MFKIRLIHSPQQASDAVCYCKRADQNARDLSIWLQTNHHRCTSASVEEKIKLCKNMAWLKYVIYNNFVTS